MYRPRIEIRIQIVVRFIVSFFQFETSANRCGPQVFMILRDRDILIEISLLDLLFSIDIHVYMI